MTILHHPSEELLIGHAAGRLGRGPGLVVDAHMCACRVCRAEVDRLEAVGGVLLEDQQPEAMAPRALDAVLARLDRPTPPSPPRLDAPLPSDGPSGVLDGLPLGPKLWLGPGVWMRSIVRERGGAANTYLLRSGPGRRLPRHGHQGMERVCVLTGAFSDETGRYGPGDFAEGDDDLVHAPRTDPDGECICLISADGPMRMHGLIGRLVQPFVGL